MTAPARPSSRPPVAPPPGRARWFSVRCWPGRDRRTAGALGLPAVRNTAVAR